MQTWFAWPIQPSAKSMSALRGLSLQWDHKDISLWMKLMSSPRASTSFFPTWVGSPNAPGQPSSKRQGQCWQFNDGSCRFGANCGYKHECLHCGGFTPSLVALRQENPFPATRTPERVDMMSPFLNRYPDHAAAQLLLEGFTASFVIPCSLSHIPPAMV